MNNQNTNIKREPISVNGKQLYTDRNIAEAYNHFHTTADPIPKQLKKQEKHIRAKLKESWTQQDDELFNVNFTLQEVRQAILALKNGKSPGPDEIMAEFFKHLGKNATKSLLALFNQTWNTHIPAEWKKAVILPILKRKKSASDLQNYRPISLTNIIAKVMERMVSNRLNWYLEHQQIIIPEQAGFRKYHSTNQQILRLSQEVKDALDKQLTTLAVFVDFKGAYDSIWRGKLMEKLLSLGVKGKMARWIYLSLNQRFCATRVNSSTSKYKQQRRGLPQGSVMSPSLFNVMINDLPPLLQTSTGIKAALFADDLVLWLSLPKKKEKELSTRMNDTLNILS